MRVDEGASSATNSGNVNVAPNGAALRANLSGNVVDDFGRGMSGVTVYAYGKSTTTDNGGNWVMSNVPVTGINVNSTPQNLEQTTDLTTSGSIYVTYSKAGYAEYKSKISNPAVITHYGTAGGNPNSIIVDNLVASESVQLPELINSVTGILIDRGSYYKAPFAKYDMASGLTVRLVPAVDVVNNAYGSAAQIGAGATECYEGCGFYSVNEMVATTDNSGVFTFANVPKIPGGYIMRVDQAGYRPMARPNDGTGFSYDYDDSYNVGTLTTQLNENFDAWNVTVQADENQNYWWGIDFDVKSKNGTLTSLEDLYVGDFLVAATNVVEGITVDGRYGTVNDSSGDIVNDGHNNFGAAANTVGTWNNGTNTVTIDSNIVDLGSTALRLIFSGDMIPHAVSEIPARGIVIFDAAGNELTWDSTKTTVEDRTLTLHLAETPTAGRDFYIRLHRDVFADMAGQRLVQDVDPNQAADTANISSDPATDNDAADDNGNNSWYTEYVVRYIDPLITAPAVENVAQATIDRAIRTTALFGTVAAGTASLSSLQASDARIEELLDAVLIRAGATGASLATVDTAAAATNTATFTGSTADVSFTAVNGGRYRVSVIDSDGVSLTLVAATAGTLVGADATNIVVGEFDGATGNTNTTGDVSLDFTATVGGDTTDPTAKIRLSNVSPGFRVTIRRVNDFGDILAGSTAQTIILADDFEPHVAIQNSQRNGQDTQVTVGGAMLASLGAPHNDGNFDTLDTAEMIFQCGVETSDDNGENEVGDAAYYFPKLNLSASLYDKSKLRGLTEIVNPGSLLSTALNQGQTGFVTAEDTVTGSIYTSTLSQNALNTPLLATVAADNTKVGTTATGRSDEYYTTSDYDSWGLAGITADADACNYYTAAFDTNTGTFLQRWDKATDNSGALVTPVNTADSVTDDNNDQDDFPTAGYTIVGTKAVTLADGSTQSASIAEGPTGCGVLGSNTYAFTRSAILNVTEAVVAPDDLTTFGSQQGVCGQNNIPTGELSATTGLTGITGADTAKGFNNDHLVLTFGDWRTIDDSNHFTSNAEAAIANEMSEGSSLTDLLQIVSLADANGVKATAGSGRGVLIVDATPPMATYLENNGSSVVIGFDQTVSTTHNGEAANGEFIINGDGVDYTFDVDANGVWDVTRSVAYIDRFGRNAGLGPFDIRVVADENPGYDVDGDGDLEVNVPTGTSSSRLTITMEDPDTAAGNNAGGAAYTFDFTDFFNEMSHTTAASASALTTVADPTFRLAYDNLEDNNFNSWANVETYDLYDGNDGTGPRLVGIDKQGPQLQTVDITVGALDGNGAYLVASPGALTITSVHATDDEDTDVVYTGSTTGPTTAGAAGVDTELAYVYGYASGTQLVNTPDGNQRLVIKLSSNVTNAVIEEAVAYVYRPGVETDDGTVGDGLGGLGDSIIASGAMAINTATGFTNVAGGGAAGVAGQVGQMGNALVLELPDLTTEAVAQGDLIVIQNLIFNSHYYSLHIAVPQAINETNVANPGAAPATSESGIAALSYTVYRQVYLDGGGNLGDAGSFLVNTAITTANADQATAITLPFREDVATVNSAAWAAGEEDEDNNLADDDTANFIATAAPSTATANNVVVRLNALSSVQATNPITEADGDFVGHGSTLSLTIADASSNQSDLTITLNKGHGTDVTTAGVLAHADDAILNVLSGTAIGD
jgi:hypothetical protein